MTEGEYELYALPSGPVVMTASVTGGQVTRAAGPPRVRSRRTRATAWPTSRWWRTGRAPGSGRPAPRRCDEARDESDARWRVRPSRPAPSTASSAAPSSSARASVSRATRASSCTSADDADLLVGAVEGAGREPGLAVDQLGDLGVDRLGRDDPPGRDRLGLTDAVDPVDGLGLLGRGPGQLGQHDVGGDLEVEPDAGGGQGADDDGDVGVVDEGVDVGLAHLGGLVAADRGVPDARAWRRSPRPRP